MRIMASLIVLSLVCGCGAFSSEPKKPEADLAKRIKALELKIQERDKNYLQAIESVQGQNKTNTDRLARMEQRIGMVEATAEARPLPAASSLPAAAVPFPPAAPPPPARPLASEAPAVRTTPAARPARYQEIASVLKDPEFKDLDRIKTELKPHATEATAFLLQELKRTPGNLGLNDRVEQIIRSFPAEAARAPLGRALEDSSLRIIAAQIIAHIGEPGYAELLHGFTADPDPSFQISVGVALVRCADKSGVPFLVQGLRSEMKANRILSIQTLKSINRREDYGYDWQKTPAENAASITQWEAWWEAFKDYDFLH